MSKLANPRSRRDAFSSPEAAILLVSGLGSRPLARSNSGSPRFTDFPLLCACSESSLTNLIGSGFNLLCLQSHSKPECRWTRPEVVIFSADQKDRGLWGREWTRRHAIRMTAWTCAKCHLCENLLPAASYSRRVSDLKVPNTSVNKRSFRK